MARWTNWKLPVTASTDSAGSSGALPWSSPDNIKVKDDTPTTTAGIASTAITYWIQGTAYDWAGEVDGSETLLGIEVRVRGKVDNSSAGFGNENVKLMVGGVKAGNDNGVETAWGTSYEDRSFGGEADLWGNDISIDDLLNDNIGAAVQSVGNAGVMGTFTVSIDSIEMRARVSEALTSTPSDSVTPTEATAKTVVKSLADSGAGGATATDAQAKTTGKGLSDSVTEADADSKSVVLSKGESVTVSDAETKVIVLGKSDSVTVADTAGVNTGFSKVLADSLSPADAQAKLVTITKTDEATLADAQSKAVGLIKADSVSLADAIAKASGLSLADSVTVSEALAKAVGKLAVDSITTTEAIAKAVGKVLADSVTLTISNTAERTDYLKDLADLINTADEIHICLNGRRLKWYKLAPDEFQSAARTSWYNKENGDWKENC